MIVGGLVIVALVLILLWAAGVLRLPGGSSRTEAGIGSWATAAARTLAAPTVISPTAPPPAQAPYPSGEVMASNPLIGVWIGESVAGKSCPTRIVF